MKRIVFFIMTYLISSYHIGYAVPSNDDSYFSAFNYGYALALDPTNNKLYFGRNASDNLRIYDLESNGDPALTYLDLNVGDNTRSMALDTYNNKLYLASSDAGGGILRVIPLDSNGNTLGAGTDYDNYSGDAYVLAINPIDQQLYIGIDGGTNCLIVYQLDSSGNPSAIGNTQYASGGSIRALALDVERRRLYAGGNSEVRQFNLDGSGLPSTGYTQVGAGSSVIEIMALDTYRGKLHCSSASETDIFTLDIDGSGDLNGTVATEPAGDIVYSLYLDASKNILYVGRALDLGWLSLTSSGDIITGLSTISSGSNIRSIVADNQRQRLYTASYSESHYYHLSEPPELSLDINFGDAATSNDELFLHWRVPNAQYVLVENTSDLLSFDYYPNTLTANTNFNTWLPAGGVLWANEATVRASTLTITAHVSLVNEPKNITVWFWEGSGGANSTSVMRKAVASILFNGAGTPTFTETITPTITPTYTITSSSTVSPTPIESITSTVTPTETIFISQTMTPTMTSSPTMTPTYTVTQTKTISATISPTATITLTLPPTSTATPGKIFYLNRNRFNPVQEQLILHLELLAQETGKVVIYTLKGSKVKQYNETGGTGKIIDLIWDGKNETGEKVASGIYYIMLKTNLRKEIKKVLVVR